MSSTRLNSFGQHLQTWRKKRGLTQLDLASLANTTVRYVSFVETGRSRPGRGWVDRVLKSLELNQRATNIMLACAGYSGEYRMIDASIEDHSPFNASLKKILDNHLPYPGCAVDTSSKIVATNKGFDLLLPGYSNRTPEESIDDFFGTDGVRKMVDNWEELAWALIERRQLEAARTNEPRLIELSERAIRHMDGIPRPTQPSAKDSLEFPIRMKVGGRIINLFMMVLRYEVIEDLALSKLRLELFFPKDEEADQFLRSLAVQKSE